MSSTVVLKCGNDEIAIYVPKENILKETAATVKKVKSAFLFLI
jgi:hypothetical protein